jgi:murein DD-endopeptidase MepM/ murein hydrolase activator NlpD
MRRGARLHALFIACALLSTLAVTAEPAAASTSASLRETRRKLADARARLNATRRSDAELRAVIGRLGGQLNSVRTHLSRAEDALAALRAQIAGEERKLARLDAERRRRAGLVASRARSMYILGPSMGAEAILGSDSIDEFVQRSSTLDYALRFDRAVMEDIARLADQSRKAKAAIARQSARVMAIRRGVAEEASVLAEIMQTKLEAEQVLASKIDEYNAEVRQLERDQARILALIRSRQSRSTGRVSRRGFIWPFRGPITSPYGPRGSGFHTGIDIDCQTGDTIVAAKAGRVIASEWGGGYGNMVIIDHGNGVSTLYAHNSRRYVGEGTSVARGQRISACGNTGHSYGDHLHFEVRINGDHTNPRPFLP